MEGNITYYKIRLNLIADLFKENQIDLLQKNIDKIKDLVKGYKEFKNYPEYDPSLADFPEVFIIP